jgi:undecaprenyl diphosphate synthase
VTETLWPDFSRARFFDALIDYQKRERRYGGLSAVAATQTPPAHVPAEVAVAARRSRERF